MSKNNNKSGIIELCIFLLFIIICLQVNYLNLFKKSKVRPKINPTNVLKPININSRVTGVFSSRYPSKK